MSRAPGGEEASGEGVAARLAGVDWPGAEAALEHDGHAVLPALLAPETCRRIVAQWDEPGRFRSRIVMERHAYGLGEYRYYAGKLPEPIAALRAGLYAALAPLANRWAERLGGAPYPPTLSAFLEACRAAGQDKPTPLLLRYEAGGFNRLHQDRYGTLAFPLQATVLLSRPGAEFTGGEFLLVEQRPRLQSRGEVVPLGQGDAVIFPNAWRPVAGRRRDARVALRHGVSRVREGRRWTLGIIFHDAA